MTDIKQPPYFSTFDEEDKYYRILARPGRPIQAREWNDLQEQLQNQIQKVGAHLFKNGAQVLPGTNDSITYRNNVKFVKFTADEDSNSLTDEQLTNAWLGKTIVSTSAPEGVKAVVIGYKTADSAGEVRLFLDFTEAGGTAGESTNFTPGQSIETDDSVPVSATISSDSTSVGTVSEVFVQRSVYFFNGDFILADEQRIFLEPEDVDNQSAWNNRPTAKVGLNIVKSIVTFEEDESLGDNATPSDSFGAPGADRLAIAATLEQRPYGDQVGGQFIELIRILNGVVQERVTKTQYAVIEDTLARRTYDESGDYTVRDFPVDVRPFLNENGNSGVYNINELVYSTEEEAENIGELLFNNRISSPTPTGFQPTGFIPASSLTELTSLCRGKLTLQIDPGKAYVKGYEIEKLAPSYVNIDRARDSRFQNNRTISTELGSFVYITNVFGVPEVNVYETVAIHRKRKDSLTTADPGDQIGTAKILAVEYFSGTHGDPSAVYKVHLFDVNADADFDLAQMQSISSITGTTFSADLVLEHFQLEGSVEIHGGGHQTLIGFGTSFLSKPSQRLFSGDYIRIGSDDAQLYQIETVVSDTELTLTEHATFTGNQSIEIAYSVFNGLENVNGLVFPLPESSVRTIRGANNDNSINDSDIDTVLSVRRHFTPTCGADGVVQLNLTLSGEEFPIYSPTDYIVINADTSEWIKLAAGSSYIPSIDTAGVQNVSDTQVKIHTNEAAGSQFFIIATVRKTGGFASKEKSKILEKSFIVSPVDSSDLATIKLNQADVLRITRIVMSPNFTTEPSSTDPLADGHRDITERYLLDNGQRDYYYDIGSVYLKPNAERPTGRVRVEFDYFTHDGDSGTSSGSYFSVDSYPFKGDEPSIDYSDIPSFVDSSGRLYDLKDCFDFRPKISADGSFQNYISPPKTNIRCDFHHYLNRTDNLYLDRFGNFGVTRGLPDLLPIAPEEPGDAMSLATLDIKAYTASPDECFLTKKDNRRYTMRDIGRIENRVSNLEYYTLLSLLEKEAKDLEVTDAQGLDRFKNGFIVDNFTSHGIGNIFDLDYRCAVDPTNEELRPSICQKHVSLIEKNGLLSAGAISNARSANNYTLTGKLFTLDYEPVKFIEQELASQVENVNPFAKFTFKGRVNLDPSTDTWRDTETLPKVSIEDESAFEAVKAGINPDAVVWGEWETSWTRTDVTRRRLPKIVKLGPNKPDAIHGTNWPRYVTRRNEITTTITSEEIRRGFSQEVVAGAFKTESLGKRIVSVVAANYMRERTITVKGSGFLPNAKLFPFFNDEPVSQFCRPVGGTLGQQLQADSKGSVDLEFELPKGKFLTGERTFKLTTSETNQRNPQPASEGEAKYYAVGWIDQVQETELLIRQFEIQTVEQTATRNPNPIISTEIERRTVKEDPIAQSFEITERGGCFLLAVDVFFFSKDNNIPIKLQLRPLSDDGYPTNRIMPFGEVVKPAADVVVNSVDLLNGTLTVTGDGDIEGYTKGPWTNTSLNTIQTVKSKNQETGTRTTDIPNGVAVSILAEGQSGAVNDMIPTRFIFESPVYLQENSDYAIVLLSDSLEYQAWVAQAGPITARPGGVPIFGEDINTVIGSDEQILSDNFIGGVFYRSSNGTTWNADQFVDLKFALHKAKFPVNEPATIEYVNENVPLVRLVSDPLITKEGSTKVRVLHTNHGHPAFEPLARVVLSGVETANGIDLELINRAEGWAIESVELDSYIIDISESDPATSSGRVGGINVTATQHVSFDSMFFNINQLSFPETSVNWECSTTNGSNVSYNENLLRTKPFGVNSYISIEPGQTINFNNPMTISSAINEKNSLDSPQGPSTITNPTTESDRKALKTRVILNTFNENLSPVLDFDRISAIAISNRINRPESINVVGFDDNQIVPTSVSPEVEETASKISFYASGKIETSDAQVAQHLSNIDIGKLITITGTTSGLRDKTDVKVVNVTYTPSNPGVKCQITLDTQFDGVDGADTGDVVITQKEHFVDEIAPIGGSAAFKYITRQLALARQSTALQISFDANRHVSHDIELYYRLARVDSNVPFEDLNWVKAEFNLKQNALVNPAYPEPNVSNEQFTEYSSTIDNLPPFTAFAIKIVCKGGNSAIPPRISNLKGIALDV